MKENGGILLEIETLEPPIKEVIERSCLLNGKYCSLDAFKNDITALEKEIK